VGAYSASNSYLDVVMLMGFLHHPLSPNRPSSNIETRYNGARQCLENLTALFGESGALTKNQSYNEGGIQFRGE
jgi:hypothetical protein